jgi:hypothetical protein
MSRFHLKDGKQIQNQASITYGRILINDDNAVLWVDGENYNPEVQNNNYVKDSCLNLYFCLDLVAIKTIKAFYFKPKEVANLWKI